tara:strand:- start:301 stop:714 length:414 start_codon:yes stop_codon:yes gene_type:complete
MKIMKIGSIVVAGLFAFNSFGQAEGRPEVRKNVKQEEGVVKVKETPEQKAKMQTDNLTKELMLTDDQIAKIYETNLAINMKNEAVLVHATWTEAQKQEALDGNNAGRNGLIKSYLTEEQIVRFKEVEARKAASQEMH